MKNIILSIDGETDHLARIAAGERSATESALVRDSLRGFATPAAAESDSARALLAALDLARGLSAVDRLTREQARGR